MQDFTYLTDKDGNALAVVIPIQLWRQLFLSDSPTPEAIEEAIEDYCLNKAIDEGKDSPLLNRTDALAYLED